MAAKSKSFKKLGKSLPKPELSTHVIPASCPVVVKEQSLPARLLSLEYLNDPFSRDSLGRQFSRNLAAKCTQHPDLVVIIVATSVGKERRTVFSWEVSVGEHPLVLQIRDLRNHSS